MAEAPIPRPMPEGRPARPLPEVRPLRSRPDPAPLRLLLGLAGIASASALTSALLPSVTPTAVTMTDITNVSGATASSPSVIHVTRVVVLKPGETAPPQASVVTGPTPTPRVHVVTTTRQSGTP
jgi:hypothetical protein